MTGDPRTQSATVGAGDDGMIHVMTRDRRTSMRLRGGVVATSLVLSDDNRLLFVGLSSGCVRVYRFPLNSGPVRAAAGARARGGACNRARVVRRRASARGGRLRATRRRTRWSKVCACARGVA